jgi:hypothetical protein
MNENKKGVLAKKRKVSSIEPSKPRNFVAKNAINSGAGAHKDKKKAMKQGDTKHKKLDYAESLELQLNQKLKENKLDEFLPALGMIAGRALVGAEASALTRGAAGLAGREIGKALEPDDTETDEEYNGEYDDEAGMAHGNLHTIARAAQGLIKEIEENDNLPEWCQEKIAVSKSMLVAVWDYITSEKEQGIDPKVSEGGYSRYDDNRTRGFAKRERDPEYHVPDPAEPQYNIKVNGEVINRQPFANRAEALAWAKQAVAAGKLDPKIAKLSPIQGVAEGSGKNVVKSVKVGNFRHDLVDTRFGWQVRIYNGDELYDTGLSKNTEQKGLAALEDAVAYTEKQIRTKRQGVADDGRKQQRRVFKKNGEPTPSNTTSVTEFAPGAGDEGGGEDPYKYPKPEHYSRSIDFFGQFEADHFDREDMDDATGVFKGYWGDTQIAYFKFDNPAQTGGDDPGMGWYYEPQEGVSEGWSQKYKSSINCSHPKGFSQKAHCAGKKKHNEDMSMEAVCPDCGMCEAHGNSKIYDKCWTGYKKVPGKKRNEKGSCKKIGEDVTEGAKVDRQAQHITKSMMKAHPGMSHDQAEAAAWAHIKHPKKKKKKVAEGIGYGSKVQHPKYGSGQVIKVYPNGMITVNFSGYPDPVSKKPGVQSNFMPGDASYNSLRMEGWTTDTLAAQLFEQEITYEDKLNSMLTKKLSK